MLSVDKTQVARQFSRAAHHYDQAASLQREMSDQLIQCLTTYLQDNHVRQHYNM